MSSIQPSLMQYVPLFFCLIRTVYLYSKRYNTYDGFSWQLERRIKPSDHEPDSFFGKSVSASGTILAVGSPGEGKVFVYRLEHRQQKDDAEREREEHEREEHEREGEGERQEHMRRLQDKEQEKDDERDKDHENAEEEREEREREEQERQEQEEHEREERLHEEEREAEWNVEMILSISSRQSNHHQEHTNLNFGCSVSVFNSSVTSIAIGASNDGIQSSTGGAYVISMPRIDHLYSEWRPHLRRRTQGHEEGENEGDHEHEEGEHEHNGEWILSEEQFSIDKSGNYWILENSMYGSNLHEQFGSNVYMGEGNIAVGGAGTSFQGKVLVYSREASATGNSWSSVVVRGPLHNKAWQHISTVYNGNATAVDHFGSSFGLTKDGKTLVVGNSYDGGGGTYIFSSTAVSTEEDTNDDTEVDVDTPVDSTDDPTDESVDLPSGEAYSSSESTGYNFSLRKIVKSVWLRRKYIAWGCAVILLVALHAKIRHYVYIRNKKNKKKRVNSLNDIDLSTNSASPMMDSSTRSSDLDSSNSVEMTYTGALQAHSTPIPQSRGDSSGIRKKSLGGRLSKSQYENRGVTSIYDGTGGLDHENLSSGQQLLHSREGVSRKNRVLPPQTYPQQSEQHYSRDDAGMNDYHYGVGPTSPPHFHHGNFHDPTRPPREMRPNHRNYNRHDGAQFDYAQQRQATSSKSLRTARTTSSHKASQYYS